MKMKRVLACALSAAMIVTFVSFGNMGVGMVHAAAVSYTHLTLPTN